MATISSRLTALLGPLTQHMQPSTR
jgi:hypothetical protein